MATEGVVSDVVSDQSSLQVSERSNDEILMDKLAEGLLGVLGPSVNEIDERVSEVKKSQVELKERIDRLHEELKQIAEQKEVPPTLESYIKTLVNCRRRVYLVNVLLKSIQDRLQKLQQNVQKETNRRKVSLESTSYLTN